MQTTRLLMALDCLFMAFANIGAQTGASCDANSITIKDAVSGSVQCQVCRKCPSGEGLSVSCGDEISSRTSIVCKPCVLGETYSSAYEAGACKDCDNCGPYRVTTKACTLTSKAECGKCKVGAYVEPMLSMCKPCSQCCNDGKDIVISQCQVAGIPANKQCSFARSAKCNKVATTASFTTAIPTVESVKSTIFSTVTSPAVISNSSAELITTPPYGASASQFNVIVGSVLGGVFVVLIFPVVFLIRYVLVKRRKTRRPAKDLALVETATGGRPEQLLENNQQANVGDGKETDHLNPAEDDSEETTVPVQESGDKSQDKRGIQDTRPPGRRGDTDFKLSSTFPERPGQTSELHSHTKEPERNLGLGLDLCMSLYVNSNVKPVSRNEIQTEVHIC